MNGIKPEDILKKQHVNLAKVVFRLDYRQSLLLSHDDIGKLMSILDRAYVYEDQYNRETAEIQVQPRKEYFEITPFDMTLFNDVLIAQVLGISYGEYLKQLEKGKDDETE